MDQSLQTGVAPSCIGVVGAGILGRTVAVLTATTAARTVLLVRPLPGRARVVALALRRDLAREVAAGKLDADQAERAAESVTVTDDPGALAPCDAVIESLVEDVQVKRAALARIEAEVGADCLVTSTTSSLPVHVLGHGARHPERIAVTHYVWPAQRRPLVEVVAPAGLTGQARERLFAMLRAQGKAWVLVADRPGFLITRVLYAYWSEVVSLLVEGALPSEIDDAVESFGWPMGPCRVMDLTGLRSVVGIHRHVGPHLDGRTAAVDLLAALPAMGLTGFESGHGLYRYVDGLRFDDRSALHLLRAHGEGTDRRGTDRRGADRGLPADAVDRLMGALVNETARCLEDGVVPDWPTAATAIDEALGFPGARGGLLGHLSGEGPHRLHERLAGWARAHGPRFAPSPALLAHPAVVPAARSGGRTAHEVPA